LRDAYLMFIGLDFFCNNHVVDGTTNRLQFRGD